MHAFSIQNRKYLGSKGRLLDFLFDTMMAVTNGRLGVFADPFAGTGVVAERARRETSCEFVIANDLLYSNYVANLCFLAPPERPTERLRDLICRAGAAEPIWGYVFRHYGERYFTWDNAAMIDGVREAIASLQPELNPWEHAALLTSLLYAADRAANTCGQYDAYLKNIRRPSYEENRHLVDENALKPLQLGLPALESGAPAEVRCVDANQLVRTMECDTLYLDPPYNARQYADLYHVLENIAVWQKPILRGKTQKFDRVGLKSDYSSRQNARAALADLVENANCRHLFLSYSDEGLLKHDAIVEVLSQRGPVQLFERRYPVFGNGAGRARKREVTERLYYVPC